MQGAIGGEGRQLAEIVTTEGEERRAVAHMSRNSHPQSVESGKNDKGISIGMDASRYITCCLI